MSSEVKEKIFEYTSKTVNLLVEPIQNRMSNSLTGSFILSWIVFNWRILAYLIFSEQNIETKIITINTGDLIYKNTFWLYFNLSIGPILVSIFYAYVLPKINNSIESASHHPQVEKKTRTHNLNMLDYDNRIEYARQQAKMEYAKATYLEAEGQTEVIEKLTSDKVEQDKIINDLNIQISQLMLENNNKLAESHKIISHFEQESSKSEKILNEAKSVLRKLSYDMNSDDKLELSVLYDKFAESNVFNSDDKFKIESKLNRVNKIDLIESQMEIQYHSISEDQLLDQLQTILLTFVNRYEIYESKYNNLILRIFPYSKYHANRLPIEIQKVPYISNTVMG